MKTPALEFQRNAAVVGVLAALLLGGSAARALPAAAREARGHFEVTATVAAVARLDATAMPAGITVTTADIQRGFIDVEQPSTLTVRTNSLQGFALNLLTVTPMCAGMIVHGMGSDQTLGADGGTLVRRGEGSSRVDLSLSFRLMLTPGLAPGYYPWPLRFTVRPLDGMI